MSPEISERSFEEAIECGLLQHGPDACAGDATAVRETPPPYGDTPPGGYRKRRPEDYDRALCLLPRDVVDFVLATQPKEWKKLEQHHGAAVREQFLKRLAAEIERRGALDVLRNGIKDSGCKFRLAYFRPASGLNEETRRLHAANLFAVVRQVRYSTKNEKSLDLVLFLNGIPIFTAELKNPLNGQDVEDAIRQYKTDRDPREPLLAYGRCLAHFAVDPDLVYVTTQLAGPKTRFLPFNQGKFGGAGNPPVPPTRKGYATAYLWEETWARDSVLDLVRQFIHEVEEEDEKGRKTGKRFLIFPRYQQLDCVRKLVADARASGRGAALPDPALGRQRQELHHRLARPPARDAPRRERPARLRLDRGHHRPARARPPAPDHDAPVRADARRGGEHRHHLAPAQGGARVGQDDHRHHAPEVPRDRQGDRRAAGQALRPDRGRGALVAVGREHEEPQGRARLRLARRGGGARRPAAETPEEELESTILAEMEKRGRLPNLSTFAFTATPKPKTLELFGTKRADGKFAPFHLYSMRQAIEEGFILDVLANYTTYKAYWRLLKKVEDDPRYDKKKAEYLLKSFVELHPHAIGEKVRIMVEHFAAQVQGEIGGKAKAMIVTRSRLHAVRYKLAVDKYLAERGYPFKALVAFSGTVQDGGQSYTEAGHERLPGGADRQDLRAPRVPVPDRRQQVPDRLRPAAAAHDVRGQEARRRERGADALAPQPHATPRRRARWCSTSPTRRTRSRPPSSPTTRRRCSPRRPTRTCSTRSRRRLAAFPVYTEADVDAFAKVYFDPKATQDRLYAVLAPVVERFRALSEEEQHDFRGQLTDYVRLYAFLAQVLTFADADLEKLYVFARHLRRLLPADRAELPREVQQNIDMESYRIQQTGSGKIALERRPGVLDPVSTKGGHGTRAGGAGDALPHHRRAERALRAQPRARAPRDARPDDGEARRRRGARRQRPGSTRARTCGSPSTRRSST